MKRNTLGYLLGALAIGAVALGNLAAQGGAGSDQQQAGTVQNQAAPATVDNQPAGDRQVAGTSPDMQKGSDESGKSVYSTNKTGTAAGMSDRQLRRTVRKAILDDKALSSDAHSVKVSAKEGRITLKGSVMTEEERSNIGAKAAAIAGDGNVTNDITVKAQ